MALKKPEEQEPQAEASAASSYVLETQIGFTLRKAHQRATDIFNTVMGGFDITPTQYAALTKLDDLGAVSQNQLGRLIAMDPATIFGVAGRLAKRGLVSQSVDPKDARLVLLELTDEGKRVVAAMKEHGLEVTRRTLEPLTAEEAETLNALIAKIG